MNPPIPSEVKDVFEKMKQNAKETEEFEDSVYLGYNDGEWVIGDNYERSPFSMVFSHNGEWFYRNTISGEDRKMPFGQDTALGCASIWYTG